MDVEHASEASEPYKVFVPTAVSSSAKLLSFLSSELLLCFHPLGLLRTAKLAVVCDSLTGRATSVLVPLISRKASIPCSWPIIVPGLKHMASGVDFREAN